MPGYSMSNWVMKMHLQRGNYGLNLSLGLFFGQLTVLDLIGHFGQNYQTFKKKLLILRKISKLRLQLRKWPFQND